jgi:hypothetical protein
MYFAVFGLCWLIGDVSSAVTVQRQTPKTGSFTWRQSGGLLGCVLKCLVGAGCLVM